MPELAAVRAAMRSAAARSSSSSSSSSEDSASSNNAANNNSHCPYAAAWSLSQQEETKVEDSASFPALATIKAGTSSNVSSVWELAKTSCPAFSSSSCPFRNAKNATDVRQTLLQLPSSHWQASYFYQALQLLHQVVQQQQQQQHEGGADSLDEHGNSAHSRSSESAASASTHPEEDGTFLMDDDSEQYRLPGGCPLKQYSRKILPPGVQSFGQAMEECSLAAIMARMARELEQEREDAGEKIYSSSSRAAVTMGKKTLDNEDVEGASMNPVDEDSIPPPPPFGVDAATIATALATPPPPPPTPSPPGTPSLAQALKTGTAASHEAAEHVHFVRNFIRGNIDRNLYAQLVLGLYHVYSALEEELERHAPSHFSTLHFPLQLNRKQALQEDVDFWWGADYTSASTADMMSPATHDYVQRLHDIAKTDPLLLLAHGYTRYLGDLSGGRILARVARKALHLDKPTSSSSHSDGLAFYHFHHVPNPKQFKDTYRQALDQLPLSPDDIDKLVLEANVAFLLNMRLFEELDVMANVPGAQVRPMQEALEQAAVAMKSTAKTNRGQGSSSGSMKQQIEVSPAIPAACPFAKMGTNEKRPLPQNHTSATLSTNKITKRCPWPFVFFHDPVQGMQDWQTWCVCGLILAWMWSTIT